MTLDRARLAALLAEEARRFHEAHPRSRALFERARRSLLGGVPMHWMASRSSSPAAMARTSPTSTATATWISAWATPAP